MCRLLGHETLSTSLTVVAEILADSLARRAPATPAKAARSAWA
jgi:hypothetical protein